MLNDNHCIPAGWLQTLVLPPFPELLFSAYAFVFNAAEQLAIDERIYSVILRNNIKTKQIPFSEMLALLQGTIQQTSAELTDAWLSLIANAIDCKKNIQTPSYSFILSQLSLNELLILRHIKKETAVDLRWGSLGSMRVTEAEIIHLEHQQLIHQNVKYKLDMDETQLRRSTRTTHSVQVHYDNLYRLTAFATLFLEVISN